jgi:hypothetical protein
LSDTAAERGHIFYEGTIDGFQFAQQISRGIVGYGSTGSRSNVDISGKQAIGHLGIHVVEVDACCLFLGDVINEDAIVYGEQAIAIGMYGSAGGTQVCAEGTVGYSGGNIGVYIHSASGSAAVVFPEAAAVYHQPGGIILGENCAAKTGGVVDKLATVIRSLRFKPVAACASSLGRSIFGEGAIDIRAVTAYSIIGNSAGVIAFVFFKHTVRDFKKRRIPLGNSAGRA